MVPKILYIFAAGILFCTAAQNADLFIRRTRCLTNIYESFQTESAYDHAENLNDGRGVTFGMVGFTTVNGDGAKVIKRYKQKKPKNNVFDPLMSSLNNGEKG